MNIFEKAAELQKKNIPFAIATIIETKGSTPRNTAKMIVCSDGNTTGTIGGGNAEQHIIGIAKEAILQNRSQTVNCSLLPSGKDSTGMECGGKMTVFIEVVNARPRLLLIGGGHVNLAVANAAEALGFDIQVAENRTEYITAERFPMASQYHYHKDISKATGKALIDKDTYIIIATNHDDTASLLEVINSPAAYIGVLGSRRKADTFMKTLKAHNVSEERIKNVHLPVGLDIGAETPEEIAVSILAEVLMLKNKKKGGSLKEY